MQHAHLFLALFSFSVIFVISVIGAVVVVVVVGVGGGKVSLPKKMFPVTWISRGSSSKLLSPH